MTYTKADVVTHTEGYGGADRRPALNVRMHRWIDDLTEAEWADARGEVAAGEGFNLAWCQQHLTADEIYGWQMTAAEDESEYFAEWAAEILGYPVTAEHHGRSGGWLILKGMPDLEEWDAITLAKWRKLIRVSRSIVDGIPMQVISLIGLNVYEPALAAFEAAEERRNDFLADAVTV